MEKIKWKLTKSRTWVASNTENCKTDGFLIYKVWGGRYKLQPDKNNPYSITNGLYFEKLSSAKQVANLLRNG